MRLSPLRRFCAAFALVLALVSPGLVRAHPIPDVPVRATFAEDGTWTLQVEVDPRCFEPDPNIALSVTNADFALLPEDKREKLKVQARDYIKKVVEIVLDPAVPVAPQFDFEFTSHENAPLKLPEDIVVLTGTWKTRVPAGTTGYSIKALPEGTLSVVYHNTALGKALERVQILFPGESSFVLDLKTFKPRTEAPPVIKALEDAAAPASAMVQAGDEGGFCASCYEASTQQTLPVVAAAVLVVFLMLWWKGKRRGRGKSAEKSAE